MMYINPNDIAILNICGVNCFLLIDLIKKKP